ncbi:MAG: hypothetical protein V4633_19600 [Pseudomonadota bacterium]
MSNYPPISKHIDIVAVNGADHFLLRFRGRAVYISPLVRLILLEMASGKPSADVLASVNRSGILSRALSMVEFESVVANKIVPLNLSDTGGKERQAEQDIYLRFTIARFDNWRWLLEWTRHAFASKAFLLGLPLSFLLSLAFLLWHSAGSSDFPRVEHGAEFAAIACGMLLIGLLHEIGHSSAAYSFGAAPGNIGGGMYLVFPVLYADVTNVWSLSPQQRVVVNLGGIYFQLLANAFLMLTFAVDVHPQVTTVCLILIYLNSSLVILNLNPFLKFDGYWVYADFFQIHNLRTSGHAYLLNLLKWNKVSNRPVDGSGLALPLHAFGSVLFNVFLIFVLVQFFRLTSTDFYQFVMQAGAVGFAEGDRLRYAGIVVNALIMTIFALRLLRSGWRTAKHWGQQ